MVLPTSANPLPHRFLMGLLVDTTASPAEEWNLSDSLMGLDSVITLQKTWTEILGGSPLEIRLKGFEGETWLLGSTWQGRLPLRRDTTIDLIPHPVYDGYYSPLDSLPRLQNIRKVTFSLTYPVGLDSVVSLHLPEPSFMDSTLAFKYPEAVNVVMTADSLFSADVYRAHHFWKALPDSNVGSSKLLKMNWGLRSGYQALVHTNVMYEGWQEDSTATAMPIVEGRWWLLREEDNLYALHALSINTVTGEQQWEWYGRRN